MALSLYLSASAEVLKLAAQKGMDEQMEKGVALIVAAMKACKPLLACGNGGSMADALHLAGELVARFRKERLGLPVIVLGANPATLTAWSNDYEYATALCREVEAFGAAGGVLLALSTSGNSKNVLLAAEKARCLGLPIIAMTGEGGGMLGALADVLLEVPSRDTPLVQQVHAAFYHYLCDRVETACAELSAEKSQ